MTSVLIRHFGALFIWIMLSCLGSACTSVPLVTMRGEPPAPDRVQTVAPEGWIEKDHMRPLGPEPTPPTALAMVNDPRRQAAPKTLYTENSQDCPPGTTVGYGDQNFLGNDRRTFRATGYGAPPPNYFSPQQKRLMTMRAAQLDALRNLTEQIYGMKMFGNTTIGDMVVENDRVRVMIDQFIRGAHLVIGNPLEDGSYEATMQITLQNARLAPLRAEAIRPRCVHIEELIKAGATTP